MIRAAVIDAAGVVVNVVLLNDLAELPGAVASETAAAGDVYDVAAGTFHRPAGELPDIKDLRDQARDRINTWRDEQEAAGIVFAHDGRRWDGGLAVRARLQPMLSLVALPPGFFWTDADDNDVPVDLAALGDLNVAHEMAIVRRGFEIHVRQRAMKAEADALDSPDALAAYTPGWPDQPEA